MIALSSNAKTMLYNETNGLLDASMTASTPKDFSQIAKDSTKKQIRQEMSIWHFLFENSREAIVLINMKGEVVDANQAFVELLGYTREQTYQLGVWDWDADLDKETILGLLSSIDADGVTFETRHIRNDRNIIHVEISSNATFYQNERLLLCICRDTTEQKLKDEKMQELISTDPLTGLLNKREFTYRLNKAIQHAQNASEQLSLILMDIDRFKSINGEHGHLVGDRVLEDVAQLMKETVDEPASIARWGGEEFIILLPNTAPDTAQGTAENLRTELESRSAGGLNNITASFGVTSSQLNDDLQGVFNRADEAMYEAKGNGRNCVRVITSKP
jgi:diguanylate cyclase (GGDEF)-like protein/PAS domain S-box-containing protein